MLPPVEELKTTLEQLLPGVSLGVDGAALVVAPKDLDAVCRTLRDSERFRLDYLSNVTAVDYPPAAPTPNASSTAQAGGAVPAGGGAGRIDLVYHLYSMTHKHGPVTLRVALNRQEPRVSSVTPIWRSAEFQEREVYDLFGVTFEGHPDLRRILMWEGFEGHPMRKDYVPENQNVL